MHQTPWIERKFDFNFPVGVLPVIVERLRGTIPQLQAIIHGITEEKLSFKKDGKWSVKEVIGHLADIEELWNVRIDDFLAGNETLQAADMANTKTTEANHNTRTTKELLDRFITVRKKFVQRIENFDESTAAITSFHPRLQKPMRLVDSLFFSAEHDDYELTRIRSLLAD